MHKFGRLPMVIRIALVVGFGVFASFAVFAPEPSAAADGDTVINLVGGIAQPATSTVTVGSRVIWVNRQLDSALTITSDTNLFDTGTLMPGQSSVYVFSTPGVYPYHALQSSSLRGVIVVTPAPTVRILIPQPPPPRVVQSGVHIPQSQVGNVDPLPPPAPPVVYLPLASAPPAPVRPTPSGFSPYGYAIPGPVQPAYPPRTGGGGLASSYAGEDQPDIGPAP